MKLNHPKRQVKDNQFVHKGDLLLVIDPTDYKIAVNFETPDQIPGFSARHEHPVIHPVPGGGGDDFFASRDDALRSAPRWNSQAPVC
jgi:hypothetical protein